MVRPSGFLVAQKSLSLGEQRGLMAAVVVQGSAPAWLFFLLFVSLGTTHTSFRFPSQLASLLSDL